MNTINAIKPDTPFQVLYIQTKKNGTHKQGIFRYSSFSRFDICASFVNPQEYSLVYTKHEKSQKQPQSGNQWNHFLILTSQSLPLPIHVPPNSRDPLHTGNSLRHPRQSPRPLPLAKRPLPVRRPRFFPQDPPRPRRCPNRTRQTSDPPLPELVHLTRHSLLDRPRRRLLRSLFRTPLIPLSP